MIQESKDKQHLITKIEKQKKKGRYNIYLDGKFAFGLAKDVILQNRLHSDQIITDEIITQVRFDEDAHQAKEQTLVLLKYRNRSIKEVRDRLHRKGFKQTVIDSVIRDFTRIGLLNDTQFAGMYARSRLIQKPMARRLLLQELRLKGIPESMASKAVDESYLDMSEESIAMHLCEKRLKRADRDDPRTKKRLYDFLQRRGFGWDMIERIFRELEIG